MTTYALIVALYFTHTPQADPLVLDSDKRYTAERCQELGKELVNWLSQDGVKAVFQCVPVTIR